MYFIVLDFDCGQTFAVPAPGAYLMRRVLQSPPQVWFLVLESLSEVEEESSSHLRISSHMCRISWRNGYSANKTPLMCSIYGLKGSKPWIRHTDFFQKPSFLSLSFHMWKYRSRPFIIYSSLFFEKLHERHNLHDLWSWPVVDSVHLGAWEQYMCPQACLFCISLSPFHFHFAYKGIRVTRNDLCVSQKMICSE